MIKLSIITINYNNKMGLKKTIESVINQTYGDFEYIIIDGESSDDSVEVIKQSADRIKFWVSEKDNGIYNAMNKGIKVAKGEYCLFLNSGDYFISNDILEKISKEVKDEEIIYGDGRIETEEGQFITVNIPNKLSLDYFSSSSLFHPSTFIKRSLFDAYGLYNEANKIVSDWEFFIKTIMINNVKARKISYEIAVIEENGISRSLSGKQILKEEIEKVMSYYFPRSVISLIEEYKILKDLNTKKMARSKKNELLIHIEKNPLASKIFTVLMNAYVFFLSKKKTSKGI